MTQSESAVHSLHDTQTATTDVLKGYSEMTAGARFDIQQVVRRLTDERVSAHVSITALLNAQREAIQAEIARLPKA